MRIAHRASRVLTPVLAVLAARGQELDARLPVGGVRNPGPLPPLPVTRLVSEGLRSRDTWGFVLRLDACLAVGEALRQTTPFGHSYWILLTIALAALEQTASGAEAALMRPA